MKKYLLSLLLIMILFCNSVYAEENNKKVKVYMFSMGNIKETDEVIEEIKNYEGYDTKFELIVLESYIVDGGGKGKDITTENQKIYDRLIDQYNEVYDARYLSTQYPTFLVGRNIEIGTTYLLKTIKKNINDENYNDNIYECIVENKETNCFKENNNATTKDEKVKEKPSPKKVIILTVGLLIVSFFMFAFIYLLQ